MKEIHNIKESRYKLKVMGVDTSDLNTQVNRLKSQLKQVDDKHKQIPVAITKDTERPTISLLRNNSDFISGKIYAEKNDSKRMRLVYEQKMNAEIVDEEKKEQYSDAMKFLEEQMAKKKKWYKER